jgi:DNA modification methylase
MGGPDGKKQDIVSGHGTQKPIECMKRPIVNNSQPGDAVYDPFCGSGTTIIAAEMTGRRALAIEIEPRYVDVAVRRWEGFTQKRAVLAAGELDMTAAAAARGVPLPPALASKAA